MSVSKLNLDPFYVHERLADHRRALKQDADDIPSRRIQADHNLQVNPQAISVSDYIRRSLVIVMTSGQSSPQDATPAAWHSYILEYCRILGVECDAVDRWFQRLLYGDLTDQRMVSKESIAAITQLDRAIEAALEAVHSGQPAIHRVQQSGDLQGGTTDDLKPAVRKAWLSLLTVEAKIERTVEDQVAYSFLREHGIEAQSRELIDYQLPEFDTWRRYISEARRHLGQRKHTPRAGRATGKSVVDAADV